MSSPPPPALQKERVELHGTARRDRSRAAVIIKQKTMVDADNKEGVRAPMRVPVGARRSGVADGYGQDQAAREKDRDARVGERGDIRDEKERKRQGNGREGCGSTHRDRLNSRAARLFFRPPPPPSFRAPPRRDAMRCPLLGQNLAVLRSPLDLPAPLGFLI